MLKLEETKKKEINLSPEEIKKLPKEEIEKLYKAISDEDRKRSDEKVKELNKILPIALIAIKTQDLKFIMELQVMAEKYCERFKCSPFQFIDELNLVKKFFLEELKDDEIDFDKKKNKKEIKKQRNPKPYTLGDAMKANKIIKEK